MELSNGRKDYMFGSHPMWEVARATYGLTKRPYVLGGSLLLGGYFGAMLSGKRKVVSPEFVAFRRREQKARLARILRRVLTPWTEQAILAANAGRRVKIRVPGFIGIFGRDADEGQNAVALARMMRCMRREDIHESGTYVNEAGVWTGWAWHKGGAHETHQTWNGQQDVCLIMVGEEFTPVSEVSAAAGGSPRNGGPNEKGAALLDLYERLGPDFLRRLNGSFSGVLVDLKRRRSMVFNDRFRLLRLHYYVANGVTYVASEAKALLKVRPELRTLDQRSLRGVPVARVRSARQNYAQGRPAASGGSRWTFHPNGEHVRDAYFDRAEWSNSSRYLPHSYYEELKDTWARVLPRYLDGQRAVGMSMTAASTAG